MRTGKSALAPSQQVKRFIMVLFKARLEEKK
jgi:hypothetical protein